MVAESDQSPYGLVTLAGKIYRTGHGISSMYSIYMRVIRYLVLQVYALRASAATTHCSVTMPWWHTGKGREGKGRGCVENESLASMWKGLDLNLWQSDLKEWPPRGIFPEPLLLKKFPCKPYIRWTIFAQGFIAFWVIRMICESQSQRHSCKQISFFHILLQWMIDYERDAPIKLCLPIWLPHSSSNLPSKTECFAMSEFYLLQVIKMISWNILKLANTRNEFFQTFLANRPSYVKFWCAQAQQYRRAWVFAGKILLDLSRLHPILSSQTRQSWGCWFAEDNPTSFKLYWESNVFYTPLSLIPIT